MPDGVRPTVHLLCGLNGAGKTTFARGLAAVRFSRDEWMLRLYGLAYDDPEYAVRLDGCTALILSTAEQVLRAGVDVTLDWNHWNRERRADSRRWAADAGASVVLHYIDVPVATATSRVLSRTDPDSHAITVEGVQHMAEIFEVPTAAEGIPIDYVR